jgi:hypothetical protein
VARANSETLGNGAIVGVVGLEVRSGRAVVLDGLGGAESDVGRERSGLGISWTDLPPAVKIGAGGGIRCVPVVEPTVVCVCVCAGVTVCAEAG